MKKKELTENPTHGGSTSQPHSSSPSASSRRSSRSEGSSVSNAGLPSAGKARPNDDLKLEQLHEASGGTGGAVCLDISVFDVTTDLLGDRRRDPLWRGVVEVHATTGFV